MVEITVKIKIDSKTTKAEISQELKELITAECNAIAVKRAGMSVHIVII